MGPGDEKFGNCYFSGSKEKDRHIERRFLTCRCSCKFKLGSWKKKLLLILVYQVFSDEIYSCPFFITCCISRISMLARSQRQLYKNNTKLSSVTQRLILSRLLHLIFQKNKMKSLFPLYRACLTRLNLLFIFPFAITIPQY